MRPVDSKEQILIVPDLHELKLWLFMAPNELSTAAVRRLIEMAGADRVGDDAVEELGKILEDFAVKVGKEATELETRWTEDCEGSGYSTRHKASAASLALVAGFRLLHLSLLNRLER